ncbi:MAG: potassium transporter TrkG [Candidatus Marinimicrobia bacterium]|nr:potassium transporter TrkG [Candidatus Neomarinimicrobiota bacterium]
MMNRGMRTDYALRQRYRAIFSYTGMIFMLGGLLMLTPLIALLAWPEEQIYSLGFIIPAAIIFGMGMMMWIPLRPREPIVLTVQEGGVIVLISWIMICAFSAFPLMIVNKLGFTQAVFESVSGYTTTGLSVVDVTKASHLILLWRSIMQLAGGAGFAIIILASITEPAGPGFTIAEGRTDQLVPNVRRSSKLVLRIYSGYAIVGVAAYCLAGMTPFEAINHAFPAISTGGFSDKPENIGHWDSATIEAISIALMIMGNLNFLTAYLFLKGKLKTVTRNGEVRLMAFLIPVSSLILFIFVCRGLYPTFGKSIRVAIFETVSALTTTGFSTVSYTNWNATGFLVLIVLMLIGGGTCSTAGGIKQYRIYLLFKSLLWEIRRPLFPRTTVFGNYV